MNEEETLAHANDLLDRGIPVIVCKPRPGTDEVVPIMAWRDVTDAEQCREWLDQYVHGRDALALIGGHGVDLVDVDTKADGSLDHLPSFKSYGVTRTPSGGTHHVVPSAGLRSIHGLDVGGKHVGDYIGGTAGHESRMLGFLPGSHRPKYAKVQYVMEEVWDVEGCLAAVPDPALVAALIQAGGPEKERVAAYVDESPERDPADGVHPYAAAAIGKELQRLDDLPRPWHPGAHWDDTTFRVACNLRRWANSNWTGYTMEQAESDLLGHAPADEAWGEREHKAKWGSARDQVGGDCRRKPNDPSDDFRVEPPEVAAADEASGWEPVDLTSVVTGLLSGTSTRPEPTIGEVGTGCLFYAGRINSVHGDSSAGKSWTALVTAKQELAKGETVVFVDLEDSAEGVVSRLLDDLDVPAAAVRDRFVYLRPDGKLGETEARALQGLLAARRPTLVVIDSTGEALAVEGLNPNADDEVAQWFRLLPRLASRCGAAVLLLDHATKSGDNDLWPIGSQRKRAAVTGAAYLQKVAVPFGRGKEGKSVLVCAKDRHGTYALKDRVASLKVAGGAIALEGEVTSATDDFRPTGYMEKVSRALEGASEPLSTRKVTEAVKGKKDHVTTALDVLVAEGFARREDGPRRSRLHESVKPYREAVDDGPTVLL